MKYKLKQIIYYINSIIYKTINLAIKMIIPILVLSITYNVKAVTETVSTTGTQNRANTTVWFTTMQGQLGKGKGQGYVIGTVFVNPNNTYNYGLKQIVASIYEISTGNYYNAVCEIGSTTGYTDSQTQFINYSFKCPVNLNNDTYVRFIEYTMIAHNNEVLYSSTYFTYANDSNEAQAIIDANNQATQNVINSITNSGNQAHYDAQQIQNAINNELSAIQSQTQKIDDIKNYDARQGDGDSSRPDDQIVEDTITAEEDLIEAVQETLDPIQSVVYDLSSFDEAFEWIWDTLQEMINSHHLIFTTVILMLFIGLSKLILCR